MNTVDVHGVCFPIAEFDRGCWTIGKQFTIAKNKAVTLEATDYKDPESICYAIENHPCDSRVTVDENGIVQTLNARMGTGGGATRQ